MIQCSRRRCIIRLTILLYLLSRLFLPVDELAFFFVEGTETEGATAVVVVVVVVVGALNEKAPGIGALEAPVPNPVVCAGAG